VLFQTASQQDKTEEYPIKSRSETDIATTLMARDYKGFGNQSMNGVIEWNKED
jgi:hypothetical protein